MSTVPPTIGTVITNAKIRKTIYAVYGLVAFVAACVQVGFAAAQVPNPTWLTVTLAVIAFAAAPIGGLAVANAQVAQQAIEASPQFRR